MEMNNFIEGEFTKFPLTLMRDMQHIPPIEVIVEDVSGTKERTASDPIWEARCVDYAFVNYSRSPQSALVGLQTVIENHYLADLTLGTCCVEQSRLDAIDNTMNRPVGNAHLRAIIHPFSAWLFNTSGEIVSRR